MIKTITKIKIFLILGGLYKGYIAQICRDLPFRALQLTSYENLKNWYKSVSIKESEPRELTPLENMFIGAVAGSISRL